MYLRGRPGTTVCESNPFAPASAPPASSARFRWRIPAGSKGKRFHATVRATVGGLTAARSFTRVVR